MNIPDRIFASVLSKVIFTKYCPPVCAADVLTSVTFPEIVRLIDFTLTLTFASFFISEISVSGTIVTTSKLPGASIEIKG